MTTRPGVWVIIRAEFKHEAKAYRKMVEMGHDAWLPQMPGTTRAHAKVKHRREWWKPTMPTVFFAEVNPYDLDSLKDEVPYFRGVERRPTGELIVLDEEALLQFRKWIDAENREILRMGRRIAAQSQPRHVVPKVGKPSKRINRPSVKRPTRSEQLKDWTYRLIKAEPSNTTTNSEESNA